MPLLGAIGNASEYSFRGTYDNHPIVTINDIQNALPGGTYVTSLIPVSDINYKVPISIEGDGEYFIDSTNFKKTFDNNKITFDQTPTTFDADFLDPVYTNLPSYVRSKNLIGLRIFGIPPKIIENNLIVVSRTSQYNIVLPQILSLDLRNGPYSFPANGSIQIDNRPFQGSGVGTEFYGKTYSTTLTIGKEQYTWNVTTKQAESPISLSFENETDFQISSSFISNTYTVTGINPLFEYRAEILTSEGELSVNYQTFSKSSIVKNGDILRLRVTSSDLPSTEKSVNFRISVSGTNGTIGAASTTWSVTTLDNVPSNFSFSNIDNAGLKTEIFSEKKVISGLSDNIDFDVAITQISGVQALLSVNDGPFVTSAKIRNGNTLQLKLTTTGQWLKAEVVRITLANTSTLWNVTNRGIEANSDTNASYLIYAFPFTLTEPDQFTNSSLQQLFYDKSPEVRLKSSLSAGLESTGTVTSVPGRSSPTSSSEQSKYYTRSYKLAKGTTTKTFEVNYLRINTDSTQALGISDFTVEMWIRASEFGFGGEVGMSVFYPSFIDSRNSNDYFFQLFLKGDNWQNSSGFRRGLLLGYPDANGIVQTICETSYQVFTTNTWHHVALTRTNGGQYFSLWVDGSNVANGFRSMNLTSTGYNFMIPNFQRLIAGDFYVQDLRLYRGIAKYTTNFNLTTTVNSIMEQYSP